MLVYHRMQVLLRSAITSVRTPDFEKKIDALKRYYQGDLFKTLCLSQFQLGNPGENFFERANPGHPGKFFCLIPCPGAKNDGRIPGVG